MIDEKKLIRVMWDRYNGNYNNSSRFSEEETEMAYRVLSDLQLTIEHMPKVGEWIPCSEMLPEKSGEYLGQRPYGEIIDIMFSKKHQKWNAHDSHPPKYAMEIVAWMPLPPAYKEGE